MRTLIIPLALLVFACNNTRTRSDQYFLKTEPLPVPSQNDSSLPYLISQNDQLLFSWVEKRGDTAILKYSYLVNESWSAPEVIARGTDWFVNWADYPMISTNKSGQMLAHYLAKSSSGTYSYDVNITRRPGSTWSEPLIPHDDGTPTEHGFVTMLALTENQFQVTWLDGRYTGGGSHDAHGGGAMTIRTAVLDIEGNISEEVELDNRVCDCCQTGGAVTTNGPVIVYRDRSEMEVRDMSIVRKVNGAWTKPKTIHADNWEIPGCPVNGPRASAIENSLAVAWFSAPNNQPQVKVIFSDDGGENFTAPVMIDNEGPLGRVDVVMLNDSRAMISWLAKDMDKTYIKARIINKDGILEAPVTIAETDEARGSGFPQMEKIGDEVYFAWTQVEESTSQIRMAKIKI